MSDVMIDTYAEYILIHIGLPNVWCLVSHLLIYMYMYMYMFSWHSE